MQSSYSAVPLKIIGTSPPNTSHSNLLYEIKRGAHLRPITLNASPSVFPMKSCKSFVLYYSTFQCYWFRDQISGSEESQNVIDDEAAWFIKGCVTGSSNCNKLWSFERIPGAILIGNDTKILPSRLTRHDCQQYCLQETDFVCRSVKFRITNIDFDIDSEIGGICTLSDSDRHLMPSSYRVSEYEDEYFENQCSQNVNTTSSEFCAYEEYDNVTLGHADILFGKKTKEECQKLCEEFQNFNCRGFTVVDNNICLLHSEDTKVHGPKILEENSQSTYYEKATCLNITVSCSPTYMTVEYNPETNFFGKVYMQGYSENPECFAIGHGKFTLITLKLSLLTSSCGIYRAIEPLNRTLLSGTMIVQYNSIIQTQGDRIIRVGCIFGNDSTVLLGTGVKITSNLPNKGSMLVNNSLNKTHQPVVEMRVLDLQTQEEVSETQIGQELQLIIELKSKNNAYDIWGSHLIAMTEKSEESIFLLDDRGCPTNLNIFPPLEKTVVNGSSVLTAAFQAFKFASSPIVRFSVIIQFCPVQCPLVDCGHDIMSYGRKKRQIMSHTIQTINGTNVIKINRSEFEERSGIVNEMPLEYILIVRNPKSFSDRLVFGENKILVAGYDYTTNEVCMDYSLVIGLIITWMLVQIIFIVGCVVLIRRYKRYYKNECTRQSLEELHKNFGIGFSNLENRRVHWADNDNIL
ncbi:hypothetical protein NQ317_013892 [Molorchus minor]|uniref:Uncharacterized protein n=1 Tax=Molorchus minor TaxID=1323400 RepID=A0ABQ9K6D9_9CUCU|nr:hypothetical protein NQ317_013892 [Molorchus minor]